MYRGLAHSPRPRLRLTFRAFRLSGSPVTVTQTRWQWMGPSLAGRLRCQVRFGVLPHAK
jgi:hypothetical protein